MSFPGVFSSATPASAPGALSAFSAYNLLRNCDYLLNTPSERQPPDDDSPKEKALLLPPKPLFPAHPMFSYSPHHIHNLLDEPTSPCSRLYGISFRRQRGEKKPIPDEQKDDKYFERRRRNNQAAKKSRDARKMREDQIALRATLLEHENALLRAQVLTLREEATNLRQMLLQKKTLELLP